MVLSTKTFEEKRLAKKLMLLAAIPATALFLLLLFVGLPYDVWWTPVRFADFLKCWLLAGFFLSAAVFLMGLAILVEDWEVRHHKDPIARARREVPVIINPACSGLYGWGGVFLITSVVLAVRYLYLIIVATCFS
jgi:hypothetical protein